MNRRISIAVASAFGALAVSNAPIFAATLYWDTNLGTSGLGGNGTWQTAAGNWSTDTAGTAVTTWTNANRDIADFRGTAGAVAPSGSVAASQLIFNVGGYSITGSTPIVLGRATGTGNTTILNYAAGTGDTTITPAVVVDDSLITAAGTYFISNAANGKLSFGGLSFNYTGGTPALNKAIQLTASTANSTIVVNGTLGGAVGGTATTNLSVGTNTATNGTFYLNGAGTFNSATSINGGTVYLGNATALGTAFSVGINASVATASVLTNGAYTVGSTSAVEFKGTTGSDYTIGGATADDSTFSGQMKLTSAGTAIHFTAASGGRVNFSGGGQGSQSFSKEGAGVVAFTTAGGTSTTGAFGINNGTFLAMNTTTASNATGTGAVTLGTGGALGGTGFIGGGSGTTTAIVTASGAASKITPGDMTKAGVSNIGTLNLMNGLVASSGATFAYDVNGATNDKVNFGTAALTLGGTVTFNFTNLGTVQATPYTLFAGTGTWTGSPTFNFNAPAGYTLNPLFGTNGYTWNTATHTLSVEFMVPEPTSLAVFGAAGICLLKRRRTLG